MHFQSPALDRADATWQGLSGLSGYERNLLCKAQPLRDSAFGLLLKGAIVLLVLFSLHSASAFQFHDIYMQVQQPSGHVFSAGFDLSCLGARAPKIGKDVRKLEESVNLRCRHHNSWLRP